MGGRGRKREIGQIGGGVDLYLIGGERHGPDDSGVNLEFRWPASLSLWPWEALSLVLLAWCESVRRAMGQRRTRTRDGSVRMRDVSVEWLACMIVGPCVEGGITRHRQYPLWVFPLSSLCLSCFSLSLDFQYVKLSLKVNCMWNSFYGFGGQILQPMKWFSVWPNFMCATKHTSRCSIFPNFIFKFSNL